MQVTNLLLLSVPLDKDYNHTLYFEYEYLQRDFFINIRNPNFVYDNCSFQIVDGTIRVPANIDKLMTLGINYVGYQNPEYNDKVFYAFITDMTYKNPNLTELKIQTDVIQTWMFDVEIKPSFVEREHPKKDTMGEHTIDEGLELGEYVANNHKKSGYAAGDLCIVVGVTREPNGKNVKGMKYNNLYSGVYYYSFDNVSELNNFLSGYDSDGIGEAITCMFTAPKSVGDGGSDNFIPGTNYVDVYYINPDNPDLNNISSYIDFSNDKLDGYTPKNKKLLCFPYRYLLAGNNAGAAVPFKYERFYTKNAAGQNTIIEPKFIIEGVICPGCSIRMIPQNYNGVERNDEEGINMGKFPILNWNSDVYTNWLTQNGVNIALEVVSGVGQIVAGAAIAMGSGGLATAVGGGSIVGGASQIASTLGQIHQQSYSAPQSKGNLNSGDVVSAAGENDFHFYDMSIRAEYARVIDEYFSTYGYKCNRVKIPEKAHRKAFWYTKTIDANIWGQIPQDHLQTFKDCYNRGITFWRKESDFKNYDVDNSTIL